jgi:TonB-dependent receptor
MAKTAQPAEEVPMPAYRHPLPSRRVACATHGVIQADRARVSFCGAALRPLAAGLVLAAATGAWAQSVPPTPTPSTEPARPTAVAPAPAAASAAATRLERVVIRGQAGSLRNALDVQQASDRVLSVVRSDDIGQLPDSNAAEALQRLPGVSVENDQGEGRYVRIRGAGPDLNSVSINGTMVPAPEAGRRAVAMDVLPAALLRSLEVSKTFTPDQDAGAIGGHVEVRTLSAFDHAGPFLSVEGGLMHDGNTGRNGPRGSLVWSDRFLDGRLGVALGLSAENRRFGSDNVETGGAWDGDALEEFERRDYLITRRRQALALNLDWRANDRERWYLRSFVSRFSDSETRQAQIIEFDDAQTEGTLGDAEVTRELKSRKETQKIASVELGGEQRFDDWKLAYALGTSRASEDTPLHIPGAVFVGNDRFSGVGFQNTREPRLIGPGSLYSADAYGLDEVELAQSRTSDRERHAKVDIQRPWQLGEVGGELKFGARVGRRDKRNDEDVWKVDSDAFAQTAMGAYSGGTVDYKLGNFGPALSSAAIWGALSGVNLADYAENEDSRLADSRIREAVDAGYVQSTLVLGDWKLLGGVRLESSRLHAQGTSVTDGVFGAVDVRHRRTDWLPALHLRHDGGQGTTLRAALTRSLVRPTFEQLSPGILIDGDEAEFGNPGLAPMHSTNFDLGVEQRIARDAAVSAYVFHKRIRNFVYRSDVAGSGTWADFDQAETWVNGERARLSGVEVSWQQALRFLPAPWNGLIVGVNAAFTHSRASIAQGSQARDIPLPSQSDRSANLMLGYETGPFSVRLAANHKSPYLLEVDDVSDAAKDQYVDSQTQLDLSARWQFNKAWQLSLQVHNLGDETYRVYAGSPSRNVQYEQYGRTYRLGLVYTPF